VPINHCLTLSAVCRESPGRGGPCSARKSNGSRRKDYFNQKPSWISEV